MRFLEGKLKTKTLIFYIPFSHLFLNFLKIIRKGPTCSFLATTSVSRDPALRGSGGGEGGRVQRGQPSDGAGEWGPQAAVADRGAPSCGESGALGAQKLRPIFPLHPLVSFSPAFAHHTPSLLRQTHFLLLDRQGNLFGWGVGSGPRCVFNRGFHFHLSPHCSVIILHT